MEKEVGRKLKKLKQLFKQKCIRLSEKSGEEDYHFYGERVKKEGINIDKR